MQHWALRLIAPPRDLLYLLPALLLLWYGLAGGQAWEFGVGAVLAALLVSRSAGAAAMPRVSFAGLLRFALYFLQRSIEGGVDVAWRALDPRMPLVIRRHWRPLDSPDGPVRTMFIATTSLLPGTLACHYAGGQVCVHSISADAGEKLDELESRVRAVFKPSRSAGASS